MEEDEQLLVAHEWEACGEGARNVVLRYTGSQAPLVGHVLRLPKRPASRPGARSDAAHARLERLLWQHVPEYAGAAHQAHRSWLFAAHVLVPLLGEREAAAGKLVTAPAQFVRALSRALGDGVVLDAAGEDGRCVGVLLPDHAHFPARALSVTPPVVTVELKPKCGFLPRAESTQQCAKRSVSRFAMHQRLKLKDGHVSKVSQYCPLDLFSHAPERMHAALRALLDAPQNNLTVRCDGKLVFGGAGCYGRAPVDDVEQLSAALAPFFRETVPRSERVDALLRLLIAALLRHDALRRLLAVQQLGTADVEDAYQAYEALLQHAGDVSDEPSAAMPHGRALTVLRDFLTAQSAKDCAIMVALQPLPAGGADAAPGDDVLVAVAASDLAVRCRAAFVDLDAKPVTKMPHYLALDRAIVALYDEQTAA